MADRDERLTEEAKQLYRKTRVPHKFCAYCGARNEPDAQRCEECGKDISWMRVPEPIPYDQAPPEAPRELPKQQKVFTPRMLIVIGLIIVLLLAFVLVLVLATRGRSAEPPEAARGRVAGVFAPAARSACPGYPGGRREVAGLSPGAKMVTIN